MHPVRAAPHGLPLMTMGASYSISTALFPRLAAPGSQDRGGRIVKDPAVAGVGGVPRWVAGALPLRVVPIVRGNVAVSIGCGAEPAGDCPRCLDALDHPVHVVRHHAGVLGRLVALRGKHARLTGDVLDHDHAEPILDFDFAAGHLGDAAAVQNLRGDRSARSSSFSWHRRRSGHWRRGQVWPALP